MVMALYGYTRFPFMCKTFHIRANSSLNFSKLATGFDIVKHSIKPKQNIIKKHKEGGDKASSNQNSTATTPISAQPVAWRKNVSKYMARKTKSDRNIQNNNLKIQGISMGISDLKNDLLYLKELSFLMAVDLETPFRLDIRTSLDSNFKDETNPEVILKAVSLPDKTELRFKMLNTAKENNDKRKRMKRTMLLNARRSNSPRRNSFFASKYVDLEGCHELKHFRSKTELLGSSHNLIFDMRFGEQYCDFGNLIKQLHLVGFINRSSKNPFNLIFINVDKKASYYDLLWKSNAIANSEITTNSYTTLSPIIKKEELVYLSPDSSDVMTEYEHGKTYIIGGLVDRNHVSKKGYKSSTKLTTTIAQMEGIASTRLPLQEYLDWGAATGRSSLTLDVVWLVLETLQRTGDWLLALKHIPMRFHRGLNSYGKELASNRSDILEFYEKAERINANRLRKFPNDLVTRISMADKSDRYFAKR